jgi:hypothetical protein
LDARASAPVVPSRAFGGKRKPPANTRRFDATRILRVARPFFNLFAVEGQEAAPALDARAARKLRHTPAALAFE